MRLSPKEFVPSGSYRINRTDQGLLIALLGTCVGVAISDRQAGVGGLAHFLLPKPIGTTSDWQPFNYASTGLPIFLAELEKKGASKDRFEASVAGGALLGPVSDLDLKLNIGGQTAEVILDILKKAGIKILKSETGGCLGAKLSLDSADWGTEITSTIPQGSPDSDPQKKITVELDKVTEHVLPIPQIALKIIRVLQQGSYNIEELTEEITLDQVICARVLQMCNSAIFGMPHPVDSVERALVLLGERHLLEIVISAAIQGFYEIKEGGYSLMRGGMFHHSLTVANVARIISSYTGKGEPGTAYTAGLIHDIGKVVLDHYVSRSLPLFYQEALSDRHLDLISLEQELLSVDHLTAGEKLARKWQLPENLIEVITKHHYPEQATINPDLVHIVYLADLLTAHFMTGLDIDKINSEKLPARLDYIGLSPLHLPLIIDRIPWNKMLYF